MARIHFADEIALLSQTLKILGEMARELKVLKLVLKWMNPGYVKQTCRPEEDLVLEGTSFIKIDSYLTWIN